MAVKVVLDKWDMAKQGVAKAVDEAVREGAFDLLARSQVLLNELVYTRPNVVVGADREAIVPEPTGALMNGGYVRTFREDNEGTASQAALAKNPLVKFGQAPPPPRRRGDAQVLYAPDYAAAVHEGNKLGMPAREFLEPAGEQTARIMPRLIENALRRHGL